MNNVISKHKDKTSENEGKNQEIQKKISTYFCYQGIWQDFKSQINQQNYVHIKTIKQKLSQYHLPSVYFTMQKGDVLTKIKRWFFNIETL